MPCKNTVSQTTTKIDKKTQAPVKTYTTKRVCSSESEALGEQEENKDIHPHTAEDAIELEKKETISLLEPFEVQVYPEEPLKQAPEMVEIVVRNMDTGEKYLKKVPREALEKMPDPDILRQKLMPDNELHETYKRWKKFL